MVIHNQNNQELEDEGEDELVLAALRYTGGQSVFNATALQDHGFPGMGTLQGSPDGPGPWYVALFPSRRLGWFENHANLEIAYERETIAEAFLEKNNLPSNVFGPNVNQNIQDRVLDHLGIDRLARKEAAMREQLAEIAGVGEEEAGVEEAESGEEFPHDLTRSELWSASKPFDPPYTWNDMAVTDAEEFLLDQDADKVRTVVRQIQQGEEPELPGDVEETESTEETEESGNGGE